MNFVISIKVSDLLVDFVSVTDCIIYECILEYFLF